MLDLKGGVGLTVQSSLSIEQAFTHKNTKSNSSHFYTTVNKRRYAHKYLSTPTMQILPSILKLSSATLAIKDSA